MNKLYIAKKCAAIGWIVALSVVVSITACNDDPPVQPQATDNVTDSAATVHVPLDSTSHEYTWQTWILGDAPTSLWRDVCAIDENNAYVVGLAFVRDSSGKLLKRNAMHWNGQSWEFFDIWQTGLTNAGGLDNPRIDTFKMISTSNMSSVWGQPSDNWVFSGGLPNYYDGTTYVTDLSFWQRYTARGIWGDEENRWFYGGSLGGITHGSGRTYTHYPFPLTERSQITSMCANTHEAWAVSYRMRQGAEAAILRYDYARDAWERFDWHLALAGYSTAAVWCDEIGMQPGGTVVMVGNNIIQYDTTWTNMTGPLNNFMPVRPRWFNDVHGTARNNIWAVGDWGCVAHFNGNTWTYYPEFHQPAALVQFLSVWALERHVFIVGRIGIQAVIMVGTRVD